MSSLRLLSRTPPLLTLALVLGTLAGCLSGPGHAPPQGDLRVGLSSDYPPFSNWKEEQPHGFSVALMESFAAAHRLQPSWVRFRWPELVQDLEAGKFDLAASGITVRPERSVAGRYTVPIVRNDAVLLLRRPGWAPPPAAGPHLSRESALAEL